MGSTRQIGAKYEQMAAEHLERSGYRIIERNYRCHIGEIDLIARDGKYLVFLEVKYRRSALSGTPAEAVGYRKQMSISKVAGYYMMCRHLSDDTPVRFDVVSILGGQVSVIRNAFEYIG